MIRPGQAARRAAARLCLVDFAGAEPSARLERLIADDHIGGVCLFRKNIVSVSQVAGLTATLRRLAHAAGTPDFWVTIDHEGGVVNRFAAAAHGATASGGERAPRPVTALPSAMALGAAGDPALAREAGQVAGTELRAMGIHLNYAPVMDVNNNAANPVIGVRAFGETPAQVEAMGIAYLEGLQAAGVGATAKHFPGHGDVTVDSHEALPLVEHGRERLDRIELRPFRAAARAGVAAVMTAHIVFPALDASRTPATLSRPIVHGLLRERWGYRGLAISDSLAMRAILDHYPLDQAAVAAVQAGCDLLLALGPDARQDEVLDGLALAIERGQIPSSRLGETTSRLAREALRWGVGTPPPADLLQSVGSDAHRHVARRIAEAAVTLVRDRAGAVPLAARRVGVVTVAPAPENASPAFVPHLKRYHDGVVGMAAGAATGHLDRVVVVTCSRGTPADAQVAVVRDLHRRLGDRLVVLATGDPYDLLQFPEVPAYLLTYGPDPASLDAAARVLAGRISPRGRLPVALGDLYPAGHAWSGTSR
ncbi:MAG: beta-N-acetylhexosaminidase [Armatimonadota bacterium]|nr:beta-N-acetylhexosaminidase [Armatimonadota bacterium]